MTENGVLLRGSDPSSALRSRRRREKERNLENGYQSAEDTISMEDGGGIGNDVVGVVLLILLYMIQGIPVGLVMSALPLLLKERFGFGEVAVFSLAVYPYSLKLLWSPVVDRVYSAKIGRRKSWIIPVQILTGLMMFVGGYRVEKWVEEGKAGILAPMGFVLIMLAATQDIAVDGWALTMLRKENLAYASTCQSVGLSIGQFLSFPVLLALGDKDFCEKHIRRILGIGGYGSLMSLGGFIRSAGVLYLLFTILIAFVKERKESLKTNEVTPLATYRQLLRVLSLPAMLQLTAALFIAKLPFSVYDNVASLKLLDSGFPKEDIAMISIIKIPFSVIGSILSGRMATGSHPLTPYLRGHVLRIVLSLFGIFLVYLFSSATKPVAGYYWYMILMNGILYDFAAGSLMFVGMGAFFVRVADPEIGGTFLTLVNTLNNFGGTWHKALVIALVDKLTFREKCGLADPMKCAVRLDGFYVLAALLLPLSIAIHWLLRQLLQNLERLPEDRWRA